jgi:hypothetical protein
MELPIVDPCAVFGADRQQAARRMLNQPGAALLRCEVVSVSTFFLSDSGSVSVRALQGDRNLDIAEGETMQLMNNPHFMQETYGASTPQTEMKVGETRTLLVQRVVVFRRLYWRDFLLLAGPPQDAATGG